MRSVLLCLFALSTFAACSANTPSPEAQEEAAAAATDECLARPELAKVWGECNVKKTIYDRMDAIGECQREFVKGEPGSGEPIMLKIRLRASGKVRDVVADEGKKKNPGLEKCLSKEIATLKFAPPPKGVKPVIYFPFQQ